MRRHVTLQAVLVGIHRAQRLAERLADAVARIRAHRLVDADAALARIKADRVIGGREDDALDAGAARRLEQVVAADDIGIEDRLPRAFDRKAAEMHDAVDAGDRLLDLRHVGEIGLHEVLVGAQIGRLLDVADADLRIDALQQLAQPRADVARGSGDQNFFHAALFGCKRWTIQDGCAGVT